MTPAAADGSRGAAGPRRWRRATLDAARSTLPLRAGAADDGVTVHVPLRALGELRADGFEWLVPALRLELVTRADPLAAEGAAASRSCRCRRSRRRRSTGCEPRREPLLDALARELERCAACASRARRGTSSRLPPHLRMRFRVEDAGGEVVAEGEDLDGAARGGPPAAARASSRRPRAALERSGLRAWELGTLPREVELPGPAARCAPSPRSSTRARRVGVQPVRHAGRAGERDARRHAPAAAADGPLADPLGARPPRHAGEARAAPRRTATSARALEDALRAALDALIARGGGPAWDEAAFARAARRTSRASWPSDARGGAPLVAVLAARREVERRLDALPAAAPLQETAWTSRASSAGSCTPGCAAAAGAARLPRRRALPARGGARLDRLPDAAGSDRDRMRTIHELEAAYEGRLADWPRGRAEAAAAARGALAARGAARRQFAPALGARGPSPPSTSAERSRRRGADRAGPRVGGA